MRSKGKEKRNPSDFYGGNPGLQPIGPMGQMGPIDPATFYLRNRHLFFLEIETVRAFSTLSR